MTYREVLKALDIPESVFDKADDLDKNIVFDKVCDDLDKNISAAIVKKVLDDIENKSVLDKESKVPFYLACLINKYKGTDRLNDIINKYFGIGGQHDHEIINTLKLVRNKIPNIIESKGGYACTSTVDSSTYRKLLINKLKEEVDEVVESFDNRSNIRKEREFLFELADVYEVLLALADEAGFDSITLQQAAKVKREKNGSFSDHTYLNFYMKGDNEDGNDS